MGVSLNSFINAINYFNKIIKLIMGIKLRVQSKVMIMGGIKDRIYTLQNDGDEVALLKNEEKQK